MLGSSYNSNDFQVGRRSQRSRILLYLLVCSHYASVVGAFGILQTHVGFGSKCDKSIGNSTILDKSMDLVEVCTRNKLHPPSMDPPEPSFGTLF